MRDRLAQVQEPIEMARVIHKATRDRVCMMEGFDELLDFPEDYDTDLVQLTDNFDTMYAIRLQTQ